MRAEPALDKSKRNMKEDLPARLDGTANSTEAQSLVVSCGVHSAESGCPSSKPMRPPAFQFYADDFLAGTIDLSTEQVGAYIRLLCYQWNKGEIPTDKAIVDRVAGCNVSPDVMVKFPDRKNVRLEAERAKQAEWREKSRIGGIKSGMQRQKGRVVQPPYEPNGQPKGNSPVSSLHSPPSISNTNKDKDALSGLVIPDCLNTEEFSIAWANWLAFRKEIKKPVGLNCAKGQIEMLAKNSSTAVEIIRRSICNGWQGLFEITAKSGATRTRPESNQIQEVIVPKILKFE